MIKSISKVLAAVLVIGTLSSALPAAAATNGDLTVTIHYARQAGDFTGRHAWIWYTGTNASGTYGGTGVIDAGGKSAWVPVNNAGVDSYGAVSTFTLTGATNVDQFGIIECSTNSWTTCVKDQASSADRFFSPQGNNTEIWLRSGSNSTADTTIYTSDSLSPNAATTQKVRVHFNRTDGNYAGYKLYLGTESKIMASTYWVSPQTYDFTATNPTGYTVGTDEFGAYIDTTLPYYAGQSKTLNMIVYSLDVDNTTWIKDGGNADGHRYLATDVNGNTEAWLVSGDTTGDAAFATNPGNISGTPTPSPSPSPTDTVTPGPVAPAISSLSVTSATSGDDVTIYGSDLVTDPNAPVVTVGGFAATVTASSNSAISFVVPGGLTAGDVSVTVTTDGGTSNSATLTITDPVVPGGPTIDSVSPESARAGDSITINGSGLLDAVVSIDGVGTSISAVSGDSVVTFTLPSDLTSGAYVIRVTTLVGTATTSYNVLPPSPAISGVTDLQDQPITSVQAGDVVKIVGTNLSGTTRVSFSDVEADLSAPGTLITDTSITVTVPESISGELAVTTPGGVATGVTLSFVNVAAPVIDLVSPTSARSGDQLVISGSHLLGGTVTIGGATATSLQSSSTWLRVTMPSGLLPGDTALLVTTEGGTASGVITVLPDPPSISSISVPNAHIGDSIVINGTGFAGASSVSFNGVLADLTNPSFSISFDGTQITVVVPDGATSGTVSVTTENGTGNFDGFVVGDLTPTESPTPSGNDPVISMIDPQSVQAGDVITIIGSNFGNNPVVTIGDLPAEVIDCGTYTQDTDGVWQPDFANCDDHSILVLIPSTLTAGLAAIAVTWDNQASASSSVAIVVQPPAIDGLSDQSGKVGDALTITGSNLGDLVSVIFDGDGVSAPASVDLSDPNSYVVAPDGSSVTVTVPAGATTGTVTVTTVSGMATSEAVYEVLASPTIDSFSVASGLPGDVVTIFGSNLESVLSVAFNGVEADLTDFNTVVADDGSSVTVVLPDGFTSGDVTVTTSGGTATSPNPFGLAGAPVITSLGRMMGRVGSVLTISGTNLSGLQSVSFDGDGDHEPVLADLTKPATKMTDTLVAVVVPAGATTGTVTLTMSGGVVTSDDVFEVAVVPTIDTLSDTSLAVGQTLVIRGSDLTWAKVRIRGVLAPALGSSTDSVLKVTVPQVNTGRTTLVITSPGGTVSKLVSIVTPAPVITSFTQSASKKRGVGTVIVLGKNLGGATVKVGRVTVKLRSNSSSTRLVFTLPKRAAITARGVITVTTDGGMAKSKAALKVSSK